MVSATALAGRCAQIAAIHPTRGERVHRPLADPQDRPDERAVSARKRTSAEGVGCAGAGFPPAAGHAKQTLELQADFEATSKLEKRAIVAPHPLPGRQRKRWADFVVGVLAMISTASGASACVDRYAWRIFVPPCPSEAKAKVDVM